MKLVCQWGLQPVAVYGVCLKRRLLPTPRMSLKMRDWCVLVFVFSGCNQEHLSENSWLYEYNK